MASMFSRVSVFVLGALVCTAAFSAVDAPCVNSSTQSKDLRVAKEKGASAIQVLDHTAQAYRVVFRSIAKIELPRRSPDGMYLAYISNERGKPWLYIQRLSTGAREAVSALDATPSGLCFDAANPTIHAVSSGGEVADFDISTQLKLLPGH